MTEEPAGQTRRALRLRVTGRVQGVGYRYFVLRLARELGVAGWVRNLSDGAVALGVVGTAPELELFKERLKVGPAGARVLALEEEEMPSAPDWDRFEIV